MSETQNLKIEAMNIAAGLIRQYKSKDSLVTLSKQIYKFLLEDKDKTLYEYLIKEKETNDGISNSLKKDESNPTVKLRLQQLSQKNNIIMDALSYYD